MDVLRRHGACQERDRDRAANLWVEQGWMFTNRLGGPVHPKVDHDAWKNLLRKAGVRDARLHDARHTTATMLLLLGVPSRAVMDVMGWSQASMTIRYQHITPELTRSIAKPGRRAVLVGRVMRILWRPRQPNVAGTGATT